MRAQIDDSHFAGLSLVGLRAHPLVRCAPRFAGPDGRSVVVAREADVAAGIAPPPAIAARAVAAGAVLPVSGAALGGGAPTDLGPGAGVGAHVPGGALTALPAAPRDVRRLHTHLSSNCNVTFGTERL